MDVQKKGGKYEVVRETGAGEEFHGSFERVR